MLHPLPVMRMTKILGIIATLVLILFAPINHLGVLKHPLCLLPFVICLFELLAYKALRLKDSTFVSTKKLKRKDRISAKNLDEFVRICVNVRFFTVVLVSAAGIAFDSYIFLLVGTPAVLFLPLIVVISLGRPTPFGKIKVSACTSKNRTTQDHIGRRKVYNHYLSKKLGIIHWS